MDEELWFQDFIARCREGWLRARMVDSRPVDEAALQRQAEEYPSAYGGD